MAVVLADVMDRADVRVIQRGNRARFTFEAPQPMLILRERSGQDLDRHMASEPGVVREIDLAHSTRAEQRNDFVGTKTATCSEGHARLFYALRIGDASAPQFRRCP